MNTFETVLTEPHTRAPKGIVYGPPGVGKTTFGASAPGALIVDCENGAAHVACARTPYLADWDSIQQWLDALAGADHPYQTVVIDSIDWLLRRLEERVAGVNGLGKGMENTLNRCHGGYGNGKLVLRNYVYQYLLPTLDRLVNRGVAVALLAHLARRQVATLDGLMVEKTAPEIHPDLINTFVEWSDFVGAAQRDGHTRILLLNETPLALAKNRYGISQPVLLDWNAFISAMNLNPTFTKE